MGKLTKSSISQSFIQKGITVILDNPAAQNAECQHSMQEGCSMILIHTVQYIVLQRVFRMVDECILYSSLTLETWVNHDNNLSVS